jgi:ankyrin repeat protein
LLPFLAWRSWLTKRCRFVKRYPDLARRRTRSSAATGLHVAVRARSLDVVIALLASDLKDSQLEAMDIYGRTPLAWAAVLGYTEIVEVLEKAGARRDLIRLLLTGIPQYGDSGTDSSDSDELVSHRLGCNTQYGSLAYDGNARGSNGDRCSCGLNTDELYLPSRSFE